MGLAHGGLVDVCEYEVSEMDDIIQYATSFLAVGVFLILFAGRLKGYWQNLSLTLSSVALGLGAALLIVNWLLNTKERSAAASVLVTLVREDVTRYHELFTKKGHAKFGIDNWSAILNNMNQEYKDPTVLRDTDKDTIVRIIAENKDRLRDITSEIQKKFRELSLMLGWDFHPDLFEDVLVGRSEIYRFQELLKYLKEGDIRVGDDDFKLEIRNELIRLYFRIDGIITAVVGRLESVGNRSNGK